MVQRAVEGEPLSEVIKVATFSALAIYHLFFLQQARLTECHTGAMLAGIVQCVGEAG